MILLGFITNIQCIRHGRNDIILQYLLILLVTLLIYFNYFTNEYLPGPVTYQNFEEMWNSLPVSSG